MNHTEAVKDKSFYEYDNTTKTIKRNDERLT
jgi:hypothetical protein